MDDAARKALEARLETFKQGLPALLKTIAQRGAAVLGGEITGEMDTGYKVEVPSHRPRQKMIAISSGRLAQSFLITPSIYPKSDRVYDVKTEGARVDVKYGTNVPYAETHERGASIQPTPKMRKFFMAMWLKTGGKTERGRILGDPFWFYLFVHASKGKPIKIPARPYFRPGTERAKDGIEKSAFASARKAIEAFVNGK